MYAVVDLETTGLRPSWHDRVVEIAIVHVDAAGNAEREWCSLVNPERDLGPQAIHGITAGEARRAPTFSQLAGSVVELLRGRVVVAHNLRFDAQFLSHEFNRLGFNVPIGFDYGLCTMSLAERYLPAAGRSLLDCCHVAGIAHDNAHSALHDARAAATLLARYLSAAGQPAPWTGLVTQAPAQVWPPITSTAGVRPVPRQQPGEPAEHFLSRLVARLPRLHNPQGDAYLDVLDRALLDRHISTTEADALIFVAEQLDLGYYEVIALHENYLQALAFAALADGVVTDDEHDDLVAVASLLGLGPDHLDQAIDAASQATRDNTPQQAPAQAGRFTLARGDTVVFTGQMDEPRDVWEARAHAKGLVVAERVTKHTRLLIAADPDSMSGKAKQAAKYGIPIIHPDAFNQLAPA
ncbi:DNA polymerase-3 subunit epsilon [Hamadaea flava]|uniref:Exonuclease domain-containing protein n=1 Tax=Hamadaea flava TaxID=1742688 RepID=A0ABV8LZ76_9ACTN|nr:exonuclease domain-containing protein [Hamadaea flava]MCP2326989.1 DNA polymerase-3 subunit epsilon [Hamadaea flava]